MADLWLSSDEVEELTARKRWSAQCRALAQLRVPFRTNAVGRPLVERTAVCTGPRPARKPREPDWEALNGKAS